MKILHIFLTNRCNFHCEHCYVDANKKTKELTSKEIKKVIKEARKLGITHVHFYGGEPFLRKDLKQLCKFCYDNKLTFDIATNGFNITLEDVKWIKKYGGYLSINLLGPKNFHNKMVGIKNAFEKVIRIIKILNKYEINFEVVTCVMKNNIDLWIPLAKKLVALGVKRFFLTYFSKIGRAKDRNDLFCNGKELARFKRNIYKFQKKYPNIFVVFKVPLINQKKFNPRKMNTEQSPCSFFNGNYSFIDCNGDVYPCFLLLRNKKYKLGNIRRSSLKKIWKNFDVKKMLQKRKLSQYCISCKYLKYCKGGCPAYAENEKNIDYRCIMDNYIPFCPVKCEI